MPDASNQPRIRLQAFISEETQAILRSKAAFLKVSIGELIEPVLMDEFGSNGPDAAVFERARRAIVKAMDRCTARQRDLKATLQQSINAIDAAYPPEY